MHVASFEGGWLTHPFWRSDFLIAGERQLERVRSGGVDLVIDLSRGVDVAPVEAPEPEAATVAPVLPVPTAPGRPPVAAPRRVAVMDFGRSDKARATELTRHSAQVVKSVFDGVRAGGDISVETIAPVVDQIVRSMERNGDALLSVTRLRAKDNYTYMHSVSVCALMINLARELELPPAEVRDLGAAGLLHDVGKVHISDAILTKPGPLSLEEHTEMRRHPELGRDLLVPTPGLPAVVVDVCLHHHERLDGLGYPFGLSGPAISRASRIAAICDVYDAMTSSRPYKAAMHPTDAIVAMASDDGHFDGTLLTRFMMSVGVFPTGTLVRLRSAHLAVVMPQRYGSAKRPTSARLRIFYSTTDTRFVPFHDIVLSLEGRRDQIVAVEDGGAWFTGDWSIISADIVSGIHPIPVRGAA